MSGQEHIAGRYGGNVQLIDFTLFHHYLFVVAVAIAGTLNGFVQIVGRAIRKYVQQFDRKIRILRVGRYVEFDLDLAGDVQGSVKTGVE